MKKLKYLILIAALTIAVTAVKAENSTSQIADANKAAIQPAPTPNVTYTATTTPQTAEIKKDAAPQHNAKQAKKLTRAERIAKLAEKQKSNPHNTTTTAIDSNLTVTHGANTPTASATTTAKNTADTLNATQATKPAAPTGLRVVGK